MVSVHAQKEELKEDLRKGLPVAPCWFCLQGAEAFFKFIGETANVSLQILKRKVDL